jgi:hypothetical protein
MFLVSSLFLDFFLAMTFLSSISQYQLKSLFFSKKNLKSLFDLKKLNSVL